MQINSIKNYQKQQSFGAKFTKNFSDKLKQGELDCRLEMVCCKDCYMKPILTKKWRDFRTNVSYLKEIEPGTILDIGTTNSKINGLEYDVFMQDKNTRFLVTSMATNNNTSINSKQLKEIVKEFENPILQKAWIDTEI